MALYNRGLDATSTCIHAHNDQMRQTCASIPVCSGVAKRIDRTMLFYNKGHTEVKFKTIIYSQMGN